MESNFAHYYGLPIAHEGTFSVVQIRKLRTRRTTTDLSKIIFAYKNCLLYLYAPSALSLTSDVT